ncbi:MAG: hypothetical protein ACI81V_001537 [Lentimonas sp.]|jgi:hypothetical protein
MVRICPRGFEMIEMNKRVCCNSLNAAGSRLRSLTVLLCGLFAFMLRAESAESIRAIEASAIPYMRFLSKADFDLRYPGQRLPQLTQLRSGWYVSYRHESLCYYFGPILLQATGEDYKAQLESMLVSALAQRPAIQGYELALTYEPQIEPAASAPAVPSVVPPQAQPATGFWSRVRRIFGWGG